MSNSEHFATIKRQTFRFSNGEWSFLARFAKISYTKITNVLLRNHKDRLLSCKD